MITLPRPGHIVSYTVEVEVVEPLHIGSTRIDNLLEVVKIPVTIEFQTGTTIQGYKQRFDVPIIPASTLKGALKRIVEAIARPILSYNNDPISRIGYSHHQPTPLELQERRRNRLQEIEPVHATPSERHAQKRAGVPRRELRLECSTLTLAGRSLSFCYPRELESIFNAYLDAARERLEANTDLLEIYTATRDRLWEELASLLCPICLLFGSPHRAAAIKVTDLYPLNSLAQQDGGETPLATRHHVSIDRKTGTKREKALYRAQYVQPGTLYTGKLYIIVPELPPHLQENTIIATLYRETLEKAQHILQQTLDYLGQDSQLLVKLGGHKTRGYGLAKIRIKQHKHLQQL